MAQQLCIRSLFYSVIMTDQKQRAATHYLSLEGDLKNYCPPDKQNTPAASIWEIKQPPQPTKQWKIFLKKPSKIEFPSVEKKGSPPVCALFSPWLRQAGVPYQEHSRRAVCHRNRPERERAGSDSVRWGRAGGAGKVTSGQEGIKDT